MSVKKLPKDVELTNGNAKEVIYIPIGNIRYEIFGDVCYYRADYKQGASCGTIRWQRQADSDEVQEFNRRIDLATKRP